ncbi:hypothetical protein [Nostoc sp.]|uniref:hypothetical protein n=1 Tax=Nostoc sp. TaxID=1180 RepID=UPI002FFD2AB0
MTTKQENLVADLTRLFIHLSSDRDANACRRMPERKSVSFRRRAVGEDRAASPVAQNSILNSGF